MLFNSIEYLFFLPIVFLLYWFVFTKRDWQNALVVFASYLFYGWWNWKFLILIAITTLASYISGVLIDKHRTRAKLICGTNITLNLGILATYKYYDFFATELAALLGLESDSLMLHLVLPVGISFYTFQALSYSIDVYRQKIEATKDVMAFAAYISFFPQLVAGPIERATNLLPQFLNNRRFEYSLASDGMRQILWGLFKKMVVADNCAETANYVFENYKDNDFGAVFLFVGAVAFAFQIYGDFSGYSDIAIGTAKLFGIRLKRNFNIPYFSRDVAEFWRRWHISLNTWFVDYVYIPLGGSREGKAKMIRNTFVIFILSGLWHGANWTFVVWGLYHALLFVPMILTDRNRKHLDVVAENNLLPSMRELLNMGVTFVLVVIGWIFFRAETITEAFDYLSSMIKGITIYYPLGQHILCLGYVAMLVLIEWFARKREHTFEYIPIKWPIARIALYVALFVFIIVNRGQQAEFIYFQF